MASGVVSRVKRSLPFSPSPSKGKEPKKVKSKSGREGERERRESCGDDEGLDTSEIHEIVYNRVNETLSAFGSNKEATGASFMEQLVPALATAISAAVSVAVTEAVKGVSQLMVSQRSKPTINENRLQAAVTRLTYENDRLQQYTRRESVRIHGVKVETGETADQVETKAMEIFSAVGADVKVDDMAAVHRTGKERGGTRPILVKFVSRRKRREVMEKKKALREDQKHRGIYINDDLTPLRARLLGYVKKLEFIGRVWTVDGKIHCLKKMPVGMETQRPIVIETPDDLFEKLGMESVDFLALGLSHLIGLDELE